MRKFGNLKKLEFGFKKCKICEKSGNDDPLLVEQRAPRPAGLRALPPPPPPTKPPHGSHRRIQLFITNTSRRAVVRVVPSGMANCKRVCLLFKLEIIKRKVVFI